METFPRKRDAEALVARLEAAIASGTWKPNRSNVATLGEYRERWRDTVLESRSDLGRLDSQWRTHLEPAWGDTRLTDLNRSDLMAWVKRIATERCKVCRAFPGTEESDEGDVLVEHKRLNLPRL